MIAALSSRSLSLLGDSGDMIVDALTYALAYIVEMKRSQHGHLPRRFQMLENCVISLSGLSLVVGSLALLSSAGQRLDSHADGQIHQPVDANSIAGCATVNLILDVAQCALFLRRFSDKQARDVASIDLNRHDRQARDSTGVDLPSSVLLLDASETQSSNNSKTSSKFDGEAYASQPSAILVLELTEVQLQSHADAPADMPVEIVPESEDDLNFSSAFTHVGADTLRTVSELVAVFFIKVLDFDAMVTDATTSVLINITICASGLYILWSLLKRCETPSIHSRSSECIAPRAEAASTSTSACEACTGGSLEEAASMQLALVRPGGAE